MDWDKLKIFHAVAEAGNFTKATYILNLSQSAISRQIQSLEQELKTQLFERHARGLSLTENGEYLFKTAHEVISKLKDVESTLIDKKNKPSWNYIQKKLIDINSHIYGSAKYLEEYGHPKDISDLNKHKFISYGRGAPHPVYNPDWALKLGMKDSKKRKPVMKVNSVYGLLLAVQSGVGLAALPDYITVPVPNIIRVLPQIEGPKTDAHFVYPQSLKNVARVIAFRNFLYSKVRKWEF